MTAAASTRPRRFGFGRKAGPGTDVRRRIGEKRITPYLFIAPHYLLFAAFIAYPFILGFWLSLHQVGFGGRGRWVGLENYQDLFNPGSFHFERFWDAVWNTVLFVVMSVPLLIIVGLFLANLLNQRFRGRNFFRSLYFVPWTLSAAVVGLTWWWLFNETGGAIPSALRDFFGGSPGWLTSNPWAWLSILIATLWWTIGFNTIILLAGMQSIPVDLYEAAAIDGASKWQQFKHITLPSLRPVLLLVVTLQIIASFQLLAQPQMMTGGGPPPTETMPVMLHIYNTGFTGTRFDRGLAAAMALVVAVMMLIVSIINFRFFSTERS